MSDAAHNANIPATPLLQEVPAAQLLVSLKKAAAMLGCCKRSVERERDRGNLRCLRIGRHWKVRVGELHRYIRQLEQESAQ